MRTFKIVYSLLVACLLAFSNVVHATVYNFGNLPAASQGYSVTNNNFGDDALVDSMIFDSLPATINWSNNWSNAGLLGNNRNAAISAYSTNLSQLSDIDFSRKFDRKSRVRYFDNDRIRHKPITSPVPEPETYAMILAGLALIGYTARRRKEEV